jgi:RNA polymerase sigma-70 factor, ECF subfamily
MAWTAARRSARERPAVAVDQNAVPDPALVDLSEAQLVARCLDGTPGAFDVVVERHRRSVYQLCYRFVGNHEDASDLSQEVFLRAYRGLRAFQGGSSLATWLYRISVNACLTKVTAKAPPVVSEPIEGLQHPADTRTESPSERLLREERAAQVRAAIARLPPKQRAALILRMYHDMSHQEIAQSMGSSVGSVKANVFHALRGLKKRLDRER